MTHEEETENFIGHLIHDDEDHDAGDCYRCGGEGWITDECFEDTCCCEDPDCDHGVIPCPNCNPEGKE